jgi:hypothetical protein
VPLGGRFSLRLTATLVISGAPPITCEVVDFSAGGARLIVASRLVPGDRVRLFLHHPSLAAPLVFTAWVVRSEELDLWSRHAALKFDPCPDPTLDTIRGLVVRALQRLRAKPAHASHRSAT